MSLQQRTNVEKLHPNLVHVALVPKSKRSHPSDALLETERLHPNDELLKAASLHPHDALLEVERLHRNDKLLKAASLHPHDALLETERLHHNDELLKAASLHPHDALLEVERLHHNDELLKDEKYYSTLVADDHWTTFGKVRILKNLLVLCFGVQLSFTAYEALMNLQSTINAAQNVGIYALAIVYATFGLSCLVLPSIVIDKLGSKMAIVLGFFGYSPYIAANFYPDWWTLLPTAMLCGLAGGPLWAARCTYVNNLSSQYATHVKNSASVVTSFFFGISGMSYQSAQIFGNIISYYVLKPRNETYIDHGISYTCGAHFCNEVNEYNNSLINSNLEPPSEEQRFILTAIFLACSILSALVVWLFLDGIHLENVKENKTSPTKLIFATFNQLKKNKQALLLPLIFHLGLSDGFLFSDFTKAYIGCAWKIYHVGYVMIAYGTVSSLISVIVPFFVKHFGRITVFLSGGIINGLKYVFLLVWNPSPDEPIIFFLIVSAWGYTDAVWWGQILALHGVLFKNTDEAAFSVFYLVGACGFLTAYVYEGVFCTHVKLYILLFVLATGIIGYVTVEYTTDTIVIDDDDDDNSVSQTINCPQQNIKNG